MANFGPSKTWTDGEVLSHTDLNASLLDIINNVTNNNINADNIDETDDYAWSGVNSFSGGHSIKVLSNAAGSIVTGTTLEWDPADGGQMTDNSSGISLDFKLPDASDNQDVFASIAAICLDDAAGSEDGELSFRVAVGGTNTEKMTLSNSALTVTPAITASGGVSGSVTSSNVSITGGSISGITDLAVADGGTNASTASAARTNLGLAIGSDIQAYDAKLAAIAGLAVTDGNIIVGNGSTWVAESAGTARTSLGLGSIATQAADNVSISGGSLTGMTSYSGGSFSGTTGVFSGDVAVHTDTLFVDVSEDRVGIGLTAPQRPLHVDGTEGVARFTSTASGNNGLEVGIGTSSQAFIWQAENSYLQFATNNVERLRILADGKVGIGTASPLGDSKIHTVTGTASSYTPAGNTQAIFEHTAASASIARVGIIAGQGTGFSVLDFGDSTGPTNGGITYKHETDEMFFATTDGTARVTILADGKTGIGTSSPEAPLEVVADSSQGYAVFLEAAASGTQGAALRGKGTYSVADAGTQTFTVGNGTIVMVSDNNTGDGAMFFCGYKSATVTLVADPNSRYANSVTASKISLTKSADSGTVTLTNNSGATRSFTILKILCSD